MATFMKLAFSEADSGMGTLVAATSPTGTLIHTAVSGAATDFDEVWIWATNNHNASVVLTVEFGDSAHPRVVTIPSKSGDIAIIPGFILNNGKTVRAYAATTNVIQLTGFVNRITGQ